MAPIMSRIPAVIEAEMNSAQRRVYDAMLSGPRNSPPVGPLAVAMHCPELAEAMSAMGLVLRFNSSFEPRLREFAILTCGRHWDCQFEWASHEGEARKAGLSEVSIATLKAGGSAFEQADEQAIFDYATELLARKFVSEAVYQRVVGVFGVAGAVELTGLIGYYAMVALMLNAAEIEVPEGMPRLPARG
ncbi:MAG: carboxymuconolactone decarboxylase family protein [Acetobacteraceae bacterium]|nr:carboxymuconolactone decarboxylase family protein [Acetobacteraceae bacterium]MSP31149.1 carboxymuconolactone decarboxylase family protein [Acetobacteraceae bacterium]